MASARTASHGPAIGKIAFLLYWKAFCFSSGLAKMDHWLTIVSGNIWQEDNGRLKHTPRMELFGGYVLL
jgi:hypothetical protein